MKLTLGMPHLNYHGLDQVWLSKQLGHRHWELLGDGPAYSKTNERLYASFFCCSIKLCLKCLHATNFQGISGTTTNCE